MPALYLLALREANREVGAAKAMQRIFRGNSTRTALDDAAAKQKKKSMFF